MRNFKRISTFAIGAILASSIVFFGACTHTEEPVDESVYTLSARTKSCTLLVGDENYASAPTTFVAKKDGTVVEVPEITYAVADPAVAEVNANGVVTPKAYGKTEVVATYKTATARVPVYVYERTTAENVNTFEDRKSTRLNSSHCRISRMPSSA